MSRIRLTLAAALVAAVTLVATASATPPKLAALVGPSFNISLKKAGTKVTKLKAGKYLIVVSDKSGLHNFHLFGPGLNKKTGVGFTGTVRWTVTLKKGTYKFICDPHALVMKGSFKVT
jgi:plastocyanin